MSNKIDSSVGPAAGPSAVRPVARSREQAAQTRTETATRQDSVALTGEARVLQQLEQGVRDSSGIDETKVAEMRRILAQGQYTADPQAIAGRLMQLEWSLATLS